VERIAAGLAFLAPSVYICVKHRMASELRGASTGGGGLGGPDPPVFEQRGSGGGPDFCTEAVVYIFTVSVR